MIEKKNICIIIPTAPSGMLAPALGKYIFPRFPVVLEIPAHEGFQSVPIMRNRVMHEIVLGAMKHFEWFCFLDNDLVPSGDQLDPLFEADGDIVGANYTLANPNAFADPRVVHGGAMRFHRKVIEKLKPPYFTYCFNDQHTKMVGCECIGFCLAAHQAGFKIVRAGQTGHRNLRSYC